MKPIQPQREAPELPFEVRILMARHRDLVQLRLSISRELADIESQLRKNTKPRR